jgi:hypothetical protein
MSENKNKKKEITDYEFRRLQLIFGFVLIIFMVLIHAFVKELPVWLMMIPGLLMGVDRSFFSGMMGNKK